MLYTENLLVRINISGPMSSSDLSECRGIGRGFTMLAADCYAKEFANHVMEVSLLWEYEPIDGGFLYPSESHCFIVTHNELSKFCMNMLKDNAGIKDDLTIEIRAKNEHAATISYSTETKDEASTEDESKDGKQNHEKFIKKDTATDNTSVTVTRLADSDSMSPSTKRLLEPFRSLHSLEAVRIKGPINNRYKTDLITSMCGPGPSEQQLFERVLTAYEDAMTTYHAGHTSCAITKLKQTNDTMKACKKLSIIVRNGQSAEPWDACHDLQFTIWYSLAWATFKNCTCSADLKATYCFVRKITETYMDCDWDWPNTQPMGHDIAMLFYLLAEVNDASYYLDTEKNAGRSDVLETAVHCLKEGLQIEPGNKLLEQQLRKKEEEKQNAEEIEDLMGISDRIEEGKGAGEDSEDTATTA